MGTLSNLPWSQWGGVLLACVVVAMLLANLPWDGDAPTSGTSPGLHKILGARLGAQSPMSHKMTKFVTTDILQK